MDVIEKTMGNFQQSGFGPSALARQQQFMEKLSEFIEEPLVMEPLWPVIFRVAGAKVPGGGFSGELPAAGTMKQLWPLIMNAVKAGFLAADF